jgi:serine/threonine-protein kinase
LDETPIVPGYRLVRPLGAGGMGSVYVAERLATHQLYAIKFLREDHLDNGSSVARFDREIRALQAIRHPHVVSVFDAYAPQPGEKGRPWVVMELLEGEGLDRLLRRRRSVSPKLAVSIMLQVLDGLAAVHEKGIVHRDLGPSNIFLVPQQAGKYLAKVLDFGLSRPTEEGSGEEQANITQQGTLMGKPAYVSPEIFHHRTLDARSDLYACGVLLFRMVAGRLPYRETQANLLWTERYHEREHPRERPRLGEFVPGLPPKLELCVAKALRIDPAERYPSAEDMQADLLDIEDSVLRALSESPLPVGPTAEGLHATATADAVSPPLTIPPRPTHRWRVIAGAAGVAVLAAVALVVALSGGGTEPDRTTDSAPPAAGALDDAPVAGAPMGVAAVVAVAPTPPADGAAALPADAPVPVVDAGAAVKAAADVAATDEPDAGLAAAPPDVPPAGPTVHLKFLEVPAGATITVDGVAVDPALGIDLPQADRTVDVVVTPAQGGLRPYRVSVSTRDDRVIRPRFRRGTAPRDGGPTVIHGQQGTTFVLDLGDAR